MFPGKGICSNSPEKILLWKKLYLCADGRYGKMMNSYDGVELAMKPDSVEVQSVWVRERDIRMEYDWGSLILGISYFCHTQPNLFIYFIRPASSLKDTSKETMETVQNFSLKLPLRQPRTCKYYLDGMKQNELHLAKTKGKASCYNWKEISNEMAVSWLSQFVFLLLPIRTAYVGN